MLKVNACSLISELHEVQAYSMPEMDSGTQYLFDTVYTRLMCGEEVRLTDLDFNRFESEDVSSLQDIYDEVIEINYDRANRLMDKIKAISPTCTTPGFI